VVAAARVQTVERALGEGEQVVLRRGLLIGCAPAQTAPRCSSWRCCHPRSFPPGGLVVGGPADKIRSLWVRRRNPRWR
jgi:hypothetical protein